MNGAETFGMEFLKEVPAPEYGCSCADGATKLSIRLDGGEVAYVDLQTGRNLF